MIKSYIVIQNNTIIQKVYGTIQNVSLLFPNCVIIEDANISCNIGDIVDDNNQVITPINQQIAELQASNQALTAQLTAQQDINAMQDDTIIAIYEETQLFQQTTDETLIALYESITPNM